jgi:DNA primase
MLRCVSYENTLNTEIKVTLLPEGKDPDGVIKEDPENWQYLLKDALPVVDYTFNKVASRLDLTTARGKTLAVGELGRIINEMRDSTRRAHYLQKLARLIKVNERDLEAELSKIKSDRRAKKSNGEAVASPSRSILTDRVEEYCLALLLQYPELKSQCQDLQPEYFTDTQNREILLAYLRANEVKYIKEELDNAFDEQVDSLLNLDLFTTEIERKCADCILRLHEKFLKNLESKRAEVLSLTAEAEGSSAELAKLEELGTEISAQLAVIMKQRSQKSHNRGN